MTGDTLFLAFCCGASFYAGCLLALWFDLLDLREMRRKLRELFPHKEW